MTRHGMATPLASDLSSELTRIVECPYPASLNQSTWFSAYADRHADAEILQRLAELLPRVHERDLQACIRSRSPCAVTKLATLVCEALPLWEYTLNVLQHLCLSPEFRDRLLLQDPGFLNALLVKASSSQQEFDQYADLCILILSRSLPESLSLPASAQSFFLRVFERATEAPDVSTLRPVYCVLNGACRKLLGLLPSEARHQFDRELCHVLSSNGTGQNSMLLLWCFGIVLLAEQDGEAEDLHNFDAGFGQPISTPKSEKQWQTASGRKLFGSTNGMYKTMNLTYLSVIWATKGDVGVSDTMAIEGIQIAIRTLQFVGQQVRVNWPNSSALAKSIFPKLPSKILRTSISPVVQLEALCFYAMIAGTGNLHPELVAQYEECLKTILSLGDAESLDQNLSISLPLFAAHLREESVSALLSGALDTCVTASGSHQLSNLITLADTVSSISPGCTPLRAKVLLALSSTPMQERLWSLIQVTLTRKHPDCHTYAESLHRDAVAAAIAMLLNLAVSARPGEAMLLQPLTAALISKQRKLPYMAQQCAHQLNISSGPSISLFQQKCTPFSGQHLQDWRERLRSELDSQSFYQRDSIVRSVAQICQDLETRCNTVEEPLRREQKRSTEFEEQVKHLGEQITSLESQLADDRFHLDGLEDENNCLTDENNRLVAELEDVRTELSAAKERGHEALRSAEQTFNARELELQSNILVHEETHNAQISELEELRSTIDQLKDSVEHSERERNAIDSRYEHLQAQLDTTEKQLEEEQRNGQRQSEDIRRLHSRYKNVEDQLLNTESELETMTGRLNDLQVSHQELIQSSEDELRETELKHASNMEVLVAQAEEEQSKLRSQLEEAHTDCQRLTETYNKARHGLQVLQESESELEAKIQELTDHCTEQEDELEELRTLRRNVLASMGLAAPNPTTAKSTSRLQKGERNPQTPREPRQQRRRKSAISSQEHAPSATKGTQGFASTAAEVNDDPSLMSSDGSQGGSTPKRRKPRTSYAAAVSQTPFSQKPISTTHPASAKLPSPKRSYLRRMSFSRRHTTVGFAFSDNDEEQHLAEEPSSRKRRASLYEDELEDSTMTEILAGTPFTPGAFTSGTGRVPEDDEDTMTEL